jgi:hypothetical protein
VYFVRVFFAHFYCFIYSCGLSGRVRATFPGKALYAILCLLRTLIVQPALGKLKTLPTTRRYPTSWFNVRSSRCLSTPTAPCRGAVTPSPGHHQHHRALVASAVPSQPYSPLRMHLLHHRHLRRIQEASPATHLWLLHRLHRWHRPMMYRQRLEDTLVNHHPRMARLHPELLLPHSSNPRT